MMMKRKECTTTTTTSSSSSSSPTPPLSGDHHHRRPRRNHHHHHVPPLPRQQRRRRRLLSLALFMTGMMIVTLSGLHSVQMLLLGGADGDYSLLYYYQQLEPMLLEAAAAAAAAAATTGTASQESQLRRSPSQNVNNNDNNHYQTDHPDHHNKREGTKLPNKVDANATSSSSVVFFPPMVAPKSIKNNVCSIGTSSSFRYVGCGYNGQAFAVECEEHHHVQPKRKLQEEPFVVKLLTIPANRSDKMKFGNGRIGMYKSEKTDNTRRYRELYQRLLQSNGTDYDIEKEKVLRHFALQRGVVNLSPNILLKATASANKTLTIKSPFRGMVLYPLPSTIEENNNNNNDQKQPSPLVIQGKIYGYYKGQSIRRWLPAKEKFDNTSRLFYEERQYQVIRDLIYIYRHLYRQHILICDLKLDHFLHSKYTNDTTLIDLDEFRYGRSKARPDRPYFSTYTEQWQQWQLLTMIANVCDYEVQHNRERENSLLSPVGLASIVCGGKGGMNSTSLLYEAEETWASSFAKCGFDRPMVWSRDMFNHTKATYEALATWSGLSLS